MITDDTRERFLREITEHVPAERIAELHLFRPLRRGGTETGVAVIAIEPESVPAADGDSPVEDPSAPDDGSSGALDGPLLTTDARVIDTLPEEPEAVDDESFGSDEDSPYADVGLATAEPAAGSDTSDTCPTPERAAVATRPIRHTVFTARYRLTRKGAERGKWEFEVVADADAPLGTVDTVVRGVQRRAGDDEEPERLTAEGVRAALDGQAWRQTT